tara:strand:+ start:127 stop:564 length:438 start_codon:yes stop_codon:yes gene_type:complete
MERTQVIGWIFVAFGLLILFTSPPDAGYTYEDASGNTLDNTQTVLVIDFIFPLLYSVFFLIGGYFILKQKITGVYLTWIACTLMSLNEGISFTLMGASISWFEWNSWYLVFPLALALLANFAFSDVLKPKPPIQQNMVPSWKKTE